MIIGCGTDLCCVSRISKIYEKNHNFANRILSKDEYFEFSNINIKNKGNFLAKHWAAKEAFAKATSLGLGNIGLQNIEITHEKCGKPYFKINNLEFVKESMKLGIDKNRKTNLKTYLSISDDGDYALAFVIIELFIIDCEDVS